MRGDTIEKIIEGILFAAGDPVPVRRLAEVLEVGLDRVLLALVNLENRYDFDRRGVMLVRINDKVQLCTRPEYAAYIRRATETRRAPSFSQAALEVLAVVAYRQPATRALIEQVRGVDSGGTVSMLEDRGLIEECGRLDVPGRPALFRTTGAFLRAFSIRDLSELPPLPALSEEEQLTLKMQETE